MASGACASLSISSSQPHSSFVCTVYCFHRKWFRWIERRSERREHLEQSDQQPRSEPLSMPLFCGRFLKIITRSFIYIYIYIYILFCVHLDLWSGCTKIATCDADSKQSRPELQSVVFGKNNDQNPRGSHVETIFPLQDIHNANKFFKKIHLFYHWIYSSVLFRFKYCWHT